MCPVTSSIPKSSATRPRSGEGPSGAFVCSLLSMLILITMEGACLAQPSITGLGPTPSGHLAQPLVVLDSGLIAFVPIGSSSMVYIYEADVGYALLPTLPGGQGGIVGGGTPDGACLVGSAGNGTTNVAAAWLNKAAPFELFVIPEPYGQAIAYAIDTAGAVITAQVRMAFGSGSARDEACVLYNFNTLRLLGDLQGGPFGSAPATRNVPDGGSVILGSSWGATGYQAAQWTAKTGWVGRGFPGNAYHSSFKIVSRDGRVGAGRALYPGGNGVGHMIRWTAYHGWQDYGVAGEGGANDMTGDGWVMIGDGNGPAKGSTVYWNPLDGARPFQEALEEDFGFETEWTIKALQTCSDNGRYFAGVGLNPEGELEGYLIEIPPFCYADCDRSTGNRVLDIHDYICFMNHYNQQTVYSNCNNDANLDIFDIICFSNHFAAGCP